MGFTVLENNTKKIIQEVKKIIPPLNSQRHKGQSGRVAVLGGSSEYTGAPFFSALSSLRTGADLAHVICVPSASTVIKSYSPDLIVHPLLRDSENHDDKTSEEIAAKISELLPKFHSIVVGPGLSRDPLILKTAELVILEAKKQEIPIVLDADGLFIIQNSENIIRGYNKAVLTPNVVEFKRLCEAASLPDDLPKENLVAELSMALGGVLIIQKGSTDNISNGREIISCSIAGGLKRCGGQGDILSGTLGTFFAWVSLYKNKSWSHDDSLDLPRASILACWASCLITRTCSQKAYKNSGRSMQSSDMLTHIGTAFSDNFE